MASRFRLDHGGLALSGLDFGGAGAAVLLLHGLAGHAGEWADTAAALVPRSHVVALDLRGHGDSERLPNDVSIAAHAGDALFAAQSLQLAPVVLVGQSLGGQAALVAAASRTDLVRGLVVVESGPAAADDDAFVDALGERLRRWPVPFPSREAAVAFFDGSDAWADGLEQRAGGWWPRFDVDVTVRTLREAAATSYWEEWAAVDCPALVVRAGEGGLSAAETDEMMRRNPRARSLEIARAGHDVHLDRPQEWQRALAGFVASL